MKCHFATPNEMMYLGKDHGWLLKPLDKTDKELYNEWWKHSEPLISLNIMGRIKHYEPLDMM